MADHAQTITTRSDPNRAVKMGRYEAEDQPPLIVTDNGRTGPWITWRMDYEEETQKSLWYEFNQMLDAGSYKHIG